MMNGALQPILRALVRAPGRIFTVNQLQALIRHNSQCGSIPPETICVTLDRLIHEGSRIEGSPQKGYRYVPGPGRFHPAIFQAALETNWWGQPVIYREETSSTMDELRKLTETGIPCGGLVLAEHQTSGRGRRGNEWNAPVAKDILCSFLLKSPPTAPFPIAAISMGTALALAEFFFNRYGIAIQVIWPNDLYVDGCKLAGILVEGPIKQENWIVGLGLNVYSSPEDWPKLETTETLLRPRTSLAQIRAVRWDRTLLLAELGGAIEELWDRIRIEGCAVLQPYWNRYSGLLGRTVELLLKGIPKRGRVLGMDSDVRLIIETSTGVETLALEHAAQLRILDTTI